MKTIELVYFDGCPHTAKARENLSEALEAAGEARAWTEWDLQDPATAERVKRFGSPTVLVDGKDVTGKSPWTSAMACRADGAPEAALILEALRDGGEDDLPGTGGE